MYYPYFRGKQNELLTIRENARILSASGFVPVIEPVKRSMRGLETALDTVVEEGGRAIVIANPYNGDLVGDRETILDFLHTSEYLDRGITAGLVLTAKERPTDLQALLAVTSTDRPLSVIHAGFQDARDVVHLLGDSYPHITHIFFADLCGLLYRSHFPSGDRVTNVILDDGFENRTNREHPDRERFGDLHLTFRMHGADGFGDFLIVGDDYFTTGGPAYAVAIHITAINPDDEDQMDLYHFVSDRGETPQDPAGKFYEALTKLITEVDRPGSHIAETRAIAEFRHLYERRHYPGLGYAKKLSMNHHVETLASYLENAPD